MDETQVQRWLDAYIDAWRSNERDAIERLFSDEAEYRYRPWDEPLAGPEAIATSWLEHGDEPDSWTAEYRPWAVDGDKAVAVGVTRYLGTGVGSTEPASSAGGGSAAAGAGDRKTVEREFHNIFLCRFDDNGRCREFTELFLERRL